MLSTEIDNLIAAEIDAQGPGAAIAVVKDGSPIYCKGHGLANASTFYTVEDEEFEICFEDEDEAGPHFQRVTLTTPFFSLTATRVGDESRE